MFKNKYIYGLYVTDIIVYKVEEAHDGWVRRYYVAVYDGIFASYEYAYTNESSNGSTWAHFQKREIGRRYGFMYRKAKRVNWDEGRFILLTGETKIYDNSQHMFYAHICGQYHALRRMLGIKNK